MRIILLFILLSGVASAGPLWSQALPDWRLSAELGSDDGGNYVVQPSQKLVPVDIDSEVVEVPREATRPVNWFVALILYLMHRAGWFRKNGVDSRPAKE